VQHISDFLLFCDFAETLRNVAKLNNNKKKYLGNKNFAKLNQVWSELNIATTEFQSFPFDKSSKIVLAFNV
jgi:hypothetical protein